MTNGHILIFMLYLLYKGERAFINIHSISKEQSVLYSNLNKIYKAHLQADSLYILILFYTRLARLCLSEQL